MNNIETVKEELLHITETIRGKPAYYGFIVDKYKNCIFDLCLRMTGNRQESEDLTQDIFLRAFGKLKQYDFSFKFSNWLYTLALNVIRNHIRRKKILTFFSLEKTIESEDGTEIRKEFSDNKSSEYMIDKKTNEQWAEKLIMALSPVLRPVFILRHIHDMKYEEIAEVLEIPVSVVKVHLNRARKYLFEKYSREYNETFLAG